MLNKIEKMRLELEKKYPIEGLYGSKASLFGQALINKDITKEEYNNARMYYGRLWHYSGD